MLRESWIADISTVLQESVIPNGDVQMLEACIKRHEAITADIMSRVRVGGLTIDKQGVFLIAKQLFFLSDSGTNMKTFVSSLTVNRNEKKCPGCFMSDDAFRDFFFHKEPICNIQCPFSHGISVTFLSLILLFNVHLMTAN